MDRRRRVGEGERCRAWAAQSEGVSDCERCTVLSCIFAFWFWWLVYCCRRTLSMAATRSVSSHSRPSSCPILTESCRSSLHTACQQEHKRGGGMSGRYWSVWGNGERGRQ